MKRSVIVALIAASAVVRSAGDGEAQSLGEGGAEDLKVNLDLPFDARGESSAEELSPDVIVFYGTLIEGDAFVFVVDRSGSMQESGELQIAKQEVTRNIDQLAAESEFAVVMFDIDVQRFPSRGGLTAASPGSKTAAAKWLADIDGGSASCVLKGLMAALESVNRSPAKRKVIVYVGDGGGTCNWGEGEAAYLTTTLATAKSANKQAAQIHTVGVLLGESGSIQETFLKSLAATSGGRYRRASSARGAGACD